MENVCPAPLLIENIMLNLRTKAQSCLSSPEPQYNRITAADCSNVKPHYWQYQYWQKYMLVNVFVL